MTDTATDITIRAKYSDLGVGRGLSGMLGMVRGLVAPLAAVFSIGAAVSFVKSMTAAGGAVEQYRARLTGLLVSVEEANRLLGLMRDYAKISGQPFENILESATMLSGVVKGGVNEVNQWMPLIGDLAAATGMGIEEATSGVIRMLTGGTGAARDFAHKGILSMLGFQRGVEYSAAETRNKLIRAWTDMHSKFRGATIAMQGTWGGTMNRLESAWHDFKLTMFDTFKETMTNIADATTGMVRTVTEKTAFLAKNFGAIGSAIAQYFSDYSFVQAVGRVITKIGAGFVFSHR